MTCYIRIGPLPSKRRSSNEKMFLRRMFGAISESTTVSESENSACTMNIDYMEIPIEEWSLKVVLYFLQKEQFFELVKRTERLKYEGLDLIHKDKEQLMQELKIHEDEAIELMSRVERVKRKQGYYEREKSRRKPSSRNVDMSIDASSSMDKNRQRRSGAFAVPKSLPYSPTSPPTSLSVPNVTSDSGKLHVHHYLKLRDAFKQQANEQLLAERSYRLQKYKNCFTGSDATTLLHRLLGEISVASTRFDAIELGSRLIKDSFIRHVLEENDFKDDTSQLYEFVEDSAMTPRKQVSSLTMVEEDKEITKDIATPATTDFSNTILNGKNLLVINSNPDTILEPLVFSNNHLSEKEKNTLDCVKKKLARLKYQIPDFQIAAIAQDLSIPERYWYSYLNPNRLSKVKKQFLTNEDGRSPFLTISLALIRKDNMAGEIYTFALLIGSFLVEYSDRYGLALVREKDYQCVDYIDLAVIKEKENVELCLKSVSKCCCNWNGKKQSESATSKTFISELFRWVDIPESTVQRTLDQMDSSSTSYPINSKCMRLGRSQTEQLNNLANTQPISDSLKKLLEDCGRTNKLTFYNHSDLDEFCLLTKGSGILNSVQQLLLSAFDKTFFCQFEQDINLPNSEPIAYERAQQIRSDVPKIGTSCSCAFDGHGVSSLSIEYPTPNVLPFSPYQYFPCTVPLPSRQ